jgi:site-specific DNA-cytosine methylase
VEEFTTWGPLLADGTPCPKRKGSTFKAFVTVLQRQGYQVEYRELRACDYDFRVSGKPLSQTAQVKMCGNSVCPPLAEALVRANYVAHNYKEKRA